MSFLAHKVVDYFLRGTSIKEWHPLDLTRNPPGPLSACGDSLGRYIAWTARLRQDASSMGAGFQCLPDSGINRNMSRASHTLGERLGFLR